MTVDELTARIVQREGGLSDRPSDRGRLTKYGITAHTLGLWRKLNRNANRKEIEALTVREAQDIYAAWYVTPFEWMPDPLRELCVDWAVTSGTHPPATALQTALYARGTYTGDIDGILGPLTKRAVARTTDLTAVYREVLATRLRFYLDLGFDGEVRRFLAEHPTTQLHNVRGWCNRTLEFSL